MDRLTTELRGLAVQDAARTDPTPDVVERGWHRLYATASVPLAAPTTAVVLKKIAGAVALVVLGVTAPGPIAATAAPTAHEVPTDPESAPPASAPKRPPRRAERPPAAAVSTPDRRPTEDGEGPPPSPVRADEPPRPRTSASKRVPARPAPQDPLLRQLEMLSSARRHLDAGRHRRALRSARKLLRLDSSGQLAPEARAIEAIAACTLDLDQASQRAERFLRAHPRSPHRLRVARACRP